MVILMGCSKAEQIMKPVVNVEYDIFNLRVDSIVYGKDGYVASLTAQDSGLLYEMLVSIPNLEERYVSLAIGDVVNVAIDYIRETDPPIIYPVAIQRVEGQMPDISAEAPLQE